ncbi:MAG: hypothetical protein COB50_01840 [Thiotrichales bacterium]|nr:MAG: hypothetical protein COB50_01840 [Thiotrichales bacterium]
MTEEKKSDIPYEMKRPLEKGKHRLKQVLFCFDDGQYKKNRNLIDRLLKIVETIKSLHREMDRDKTAKQRIKLKIIEFYEAIITLPYKNVKVHLSKGMKLHNDETNTDDYKQESESLPKNDKKLRKYEKELLEGKLDDVQGYTNLLAEMKKSKPSSPTLFNKLETVIKTSRKIKGEKRSKNKTVFSKARYLTIMGLSNLVKQLKRETSDDVSNDAKEIEANIFLGIVNEITQEFETILHNFLYWFTQQEYVSSKGGRLVTVAEAKQHQSAKDTLLSNCRNYKELLPNGEDVKEQVIKQQQEKIRLYAGEEIKCAEERNKKIAICKPIKQTIIKSMEKKKQMEKEELKDFTAQRISMLQGMRQLQKGITKCYSITKKQKDIIAAVYEEWKEQKSGTPLSPEIIKKKVQLVWEALVEQDPKLDINKNEKTEKKKSQCKTVAYILCGHIKTEYNVKLKADVFLLNRQLVDCMGIVKIIFNNNKKLDEKSISAFIQKKLDNMPLDLKCEKFVKHCKATYKITYKRSDFSDNNKLITLDSMKKKILATLKDKNPDYTKQQKVIALFNTYDTEVQDLEKAREEVDKNLLQAYDNCCNAIKKNKKTLTKELNGMDINVETYLAKEDMPFTVGHAESIAKIKKYKRDIIFLQKHSSKKFKKSEEKLAEKFEKFEKANQKIDTIKLVNLEKYHIQCEKDNLVKSMLEQFQAKLKKTVCSSDETITTEKHISTMVTVANFVCWSSECSSAQLCSRTKEIFSKASFVREELQKLDRSMLSNKFSAENQKKYIGLLRLLAQLENSTTVSSKLLLPNGVPDEKEINKNNDIVGERNNIRHIVMHSLDLINQTYPIMINQEVRKNINAVGRCLLEEMIPYMIENIEYLTGEKDCASQKDKNKIHGILKILNDANDQLRKILNKTLGVRRLAKIKDLLLLDKDIFKTNKVDKYNLLVGELTDILPTLKKVRVAPDFCKSLNANRTLLQKERFKGEMLIFKSSIVIGKKILKVLNAKLLQTENKNEEQTSLSCNDILVDALLQALGQTLGNLREYKKILPNIGDIPVAISIRKDLRNLHSFVPLIKEYRNLLTHCGVISNAKSGKILALIKNDCTTLVNQLEKLEKIVMKHVNNNNVAKFGTYENAHVDYINTISEFNNYNCVVL